MSDRWSTHVLTDVLDFREGPGILAVDFRDEGIPLIRLSGLKKGAQLLTGCNYLDRSMVDRRWNQFRIRNGDVLLSTSASLGEVAVAGRDGVGAIPYTGIIAFRPKDVRVLPAFIPHMLNAPTFKAQIGAMGVGSVMRHFGPSHLRAMFVSFPAIGVQQAIAEVLGAIDDKIAANVRLAQTANLLAESEWRLAASTAARVVPLGALARLDYGQALKSGDRIPGDVVVYGSGGPTGSHTEALVGHAGIVLGRKGTAGAVYWAAGPHFPIDTTYSVAAIGEVSLEYLYFALKSMRLGDMNSDSAVPGLNRTEALSCRMSDPSPAALTRFESVVPLLMRLQNGLASESGALQRTRDELLPLLMSGKVRVKEAEHVVEGVL